MGKFEEEASRKVLAGEQIDVKTRFGLLDFLLYPYRAWKEKKRQAKLKQQMWDKMVADSDKVAHDKDAWIHKAITEVEDDAQVVKKDDWLYGIISEDDTNNTKEK